MANGYKIVVPSGNGYTYQTIKRRVVPHLEQLGITINVSENLNIIFPKGIILAKFEIMELLLKKHYGLELQEIK